MTDIGDVDSKNH